MQGSNLQAYADDLLGAQAPEDEVIVSDVVADDETEGEKDDTVVTDEVETESDDEDVVTETESETPPAAETEEAEEAETPKATTTSVEHHLRPADERVDACWRVVRDQDRRVDDAPGRQRWIVPRSQLGRVRQLYHSCPGKRFQRDRDRPC